VHALYNFVASFGGPAGASSQRAWSRVADMLAGGTSHKARLPALCAHGSEPSVRAKLFRQSGHYKRSGLLATRVRLSQCQGFCCACAEFWLVLWL